MHHKFFTPLRYPGGKAGLGQWIAYLMRQNHISGGSYTEPYAGGAGVALYLLLNEYVDKIVINDADPLIYSFWWSIINDSASLIKMIERTPVDIDNWLKQKEIAKNSAQYSHLERGFAAFFLNRSNRSGILKGGVIGGLDQTGAYKIDARFNKNELIGRIQHIAKKKRAIEVLNIDALELIEMHKEKNDEKSLIYLDPPYFNKGSQLYRNFYSPSDHAEVAKSITSLKTPWLVTYDNCEPIQKLYYAEKSLEFSLVYSTNVIRPTTTEIMVYGNLSIPRTPKIHKSVRPYPKEWDLVA